MENSNEIKNQEKVNFITFNFCPNCGKECDTSSSFCVSCGNMLHLDYNEKKRNLNTENVMNSQFFEKITPTKQKLSNIKTFIKNNVELSVLLAIIVFIILLLSFTWGILLLCIVLSSYYLWGVLKYTEETPLNVEVRNSYKAILKQIKDKKDTVIKKSQTTPSREQRNLHTTTESQMQIDEKTNTSVPVKSQIKPVRLGITGFLLIISSGLSLYGLLGTGFFSFSEASLSQIFATSGKYLSYFEQMGELFTGSSEENSTTLFIIGKTLIALPILVILFTLIPSIFGHFFALLFALVEVILLYIIVDTLGEIASFVLGNYSDDFFAIVLEYGDEVVGLPAIALIFGAIGMVVFSVLKIFSNLNRY